jgi:hypothetical protein
MGGGLDPRRPLLSSSHYWVAHDRGLVFMFCETLQDFVRFLSPRIAWGIGRGLMLASALILPSLEPNPPKVEVRCAPAESERSHGVYSVRLSAGDRSATCDVTVLSRGWFGPLELTPQALLPEGSGTLRAYFGWLPLRPGRNVSTKGSIEFIAPQGLAWQPFLYEISFLNLAGRSTTILMRFERSP